MPVGNKSGYTSGSSGSGAGITKGAVGSVQVNRRAPSGKAGRGVGGLPSRYGLTTAQPKRVAVTGIGGNPPTGKTKAIT